MKGKWKLLLLCIGLPLAVGGLAGFLTKDSMKLFENLNQPPLSPPGWIFPVVWTVLYVLMGLASWLVVTSDGEPVKKYRALTVYVLQLVFNFFWSILFFNQQAYLGAFFWLVALWVLVFLTMVLFYRIRPLAGDLLLPYLLWVTFAGYLNYGIYLLNEVPGK